MALVKSVFGRQGDVVAADGDYNAEQITNDSSVDGGTVKAALNTLLTSIGGLTSSLISNVSGVAGGTVTAALETLATAIASIPPAPVTTVFARVGDVVAALNDYATSLITNDSLIPGATDKDALNFLFLNYRHAFVRPVVNSSSAPVNSGTGAGPNWTAVGTAVASGALADTDWLSRQVRFLGRDTSGVNSNGGVQGLGGGVTGWLQRRNGFVMRLQWAYEDAVHTQGRVFHGGITTNFGLTDPKTVPNLFGCYGDLSVSPNLSLLTRDASAGAPATLGPNFPIVARAAYELFIQADPANTTQLKYRVRRLDAPSAAADVSGVLTTNLPDVAAFHWVITEVMNPNAQATASTCAFLTYDQWMPV